MAGLFAYLEGSPLVFIELNHVSADRFGLFFGIIAAGLIGASQVNGFLVRRAHPGSILRSCSVHFRRRRASLCSRRSRRTSAGFRD